MSVSFSSKAYFIVKSPSGNWYNGPGCSAELTWRTVRTSCWWVKPRFALEVGAKVCQSHQLALSQWEPEFSRAQTSTDAFCITRLGKLSFLLYKYTNKSEQAVCQLRQWSCILPGPGGQPAQWCLIWQYLGGHIHTQMNRRWCLEIWAGS